VPTLTLPVSAYSIQSAKPSQKYGMITPLPVQLSNSAMLASVSVAKIPRGAVVTSAVLQWWGWGTFTGTSTLAATLPTQGWNSSVTWASRPSLSAAVATVSKTSPVAGAQWAFDITASVQAWVSGTSKNNGVQVAQTSGPAMKMRGTKATEAQPVLVVTYAMVPATPTNLSPSSGMVSLAKPTLSFDADDGITQARVQISPPPGGGTPDYDVTVNVVAGLVDLSTTAYTGLADGAVKVWRVQQKNSLGWSLWSAWATIARSSKPVLTITSPVSGTITDGTPPIQWSLASGQQTAWRVDFFDAATKLLATSGKVAGTATSWTPPRGLVSDGQTGTIKVTVWDDVDRSSGPGDPVTVVAYLPVTLTLSNAVTPVDSINVAQQQPSPVVILTGARAAGIPDEVIVYRNGVQVGRYPGASVFTGTSYTIRDATAPMSSPATYRVAAVVNGVIAKGGPTKTYTPTCAGIWLFDNDDPTQCAVVWPEDDQDQSAPEQSIEHIPISADGAIEVVRRRMVRLPPQGSIEGRLVDSFGTLATDSETALATFAENDAGHLYRLVLGRKNYLCIVGNIDSAEQVDDTLGQRLVAVTYDWWAKAGQ